MFGSGEHVRPSVRAAAQRRPQVGDLRPKRFASATPALTGQAVPNAKRSVSSASLCASRRPAYHRAPSPQSFRHPSFFRLKAEATSKNIRPGGGSYEPASSVVGRLPPEGGSCDAVRRRKAESVNAGTPRWKATGPGTDDHVRTARARRRGRCAAETDLTIVRPCQFRKANIGLRNGRADQRTNGRCLQRCRTPQPHVAILIAAPEENLLRIGKRRAVVEREHHTFRGCRQGDDAIGGTNALGQIRSRGNCNCRKRARWPWAAACAGPPASSGATRRRQRRTSR